MKEQRKPVVKRARNGQYMEEAGHELGFFRNMAEIKALASIGKWWKKDNGNNENEKNC
ncbi:hypothetical protein [Alteribacillus bidgolensis]|uniref:Uncharacterized protein n=1 Tax=Alteribacillus bidgolensis TaxID=930129 RepID=A0A1G8GEQ3_9BACI|nr:hypothetical protein [Alteribacillus bidgolensis]SDH92869.1 hypothetical protein SAMN05216352_103366 [Alteribacillus bidgolensis]